MRRCVILTDSAMTGRTFIFSTIKTRTNPAYMIHTTSTKIHIRGFNLIIKPFLFLHIFPASPALST
jgi:hypothetical protein